MKPGRAAWPCWLDALPKTSRLQHSSKPAAAVAKDVGRMLCEDISVCVRRPIRCGDNRLAIKVSCELGPLTSCVIQGSIEQLGYYITGTTDSASPCRGGLHCHNHLHASHNMPSITCRATGARSGSSVEDSKSLQMQCIDLTDFDCMLLFEVLALQAIRNSSL